MISTRPDPVDFTLWQTELEDGSQAHIGLLICLLTLFGEIALLWWALT